MEQDEWSRTLQENDGHGYDDAGYDDQAYDDQA